MLKVLKKEAERFSKQGMAFVHSEWKLGQGVETLLSGDLLGQVYIVTCIIDRIANITNESFEHTIEAIQVLRDHAGDVEVVKPGETVDTTATLREQMEKAITADVEKAYAHKLQALERKNNRLEIEVASHMSTIKRLQDKVEAVRKAGSAEVDDLQKEVIRLNKELDSCYEKIQSMV